MGKTERRTIHELLDFVITTGGLSKDMAGWIDPKEQSAEAWGGRRSSQRSGSDDRAGADTAASDDRSEDPASLEPIEGTIARALAVDLPYQYGEMVAYDGTLPDLGEDVTDDSARVVVDGGVTTDGHLKLLARGYLWSDDGATVNGQRFKLQLRRPGPPTETTPVGTYRGWYRYQPGILRSTTGIEFEPADAPETERPTLEFDAVPRPLRRHIVKLELVRNPPFARYVLEERDQWEEWDASIRWDPDAFS